MGEWGSGGGGGGNQKMMMAEKEQGRGRGGRQGHKGLSTQYEAITQPLVASLVCVEAAWFAKLNCGLDQ